MKGRLCLLLAGLLAAGAVLTGCAGAKSASSESSQVFAMDTVMLLTVYGDQAKEGIDQATQTIQKLEKLWSATDEESEIWALNHSEGNWVDLSPETEQVLGRSLPAAEGGQRHLQPQPGAVRSHRRRPGPHRLLRRPGLGIPHRGVPGAGSGGAGPGGG